MAGFAWVVESQGSSGGACVCERAAVVFGGSFRAAAKEARALFSNVSRCAVAVANRQGLELTCCSCCALGIVLLCDWAMKRLRLHSNVFACVALRSISFWRNWRFFSSVPSLSSSFWSIMVTSWSSSEHMPTCDAADVAILADGNPNVAQLCLTFGTGGTNRFS